MTLKAVYGVMSAKTQLEWAEERLWKEGEKWLYIDSSFKKFCCDADKKWGSEVTWRRNAKKGRAFAFKIVYTRASLLQTGWFSSGTTDGRRKGIIAGRKPREGKRLGCRVQLERWPLIAGTFHLLEEEESGHWCGWVNITGSEKIRLSV